ncbi:hypothetical protein ASE86_07580 [Sphingomonas sp. Leaf33]|uniref:KAP family P-loop NTPase fold protein n=1 Tax=Sphingomonas sp. Leaf33 TaxID=1736215 RepID=UPI0006FA970F|nr:P-loop NTPase fold protein [Sphingomonas sp. Leaf33]KQN26020.1 hypothetical protein ASE86_07580 [Sphingomonas sp. Leaf33]
MWSDNQTARDLLNFQHVADIAAERIFGAKGQPLSIGISGGWGMGKSSMMELLHISLKQRVAELAMAHSVAIEAGHESVAPDEVRFVNFNAWLYQGHDDARAALMEAIAQSLVDHAEKEKGRFGAGVLKKAKGLLSRVKWFRAASMTGGAALALYTGSPLPLMFTSVAAAGGGLMDGDLSSGDVEKLKTAYESISKEGKDLLAAKKEDEKVAATTPPKAIDTFRTELQATLKEMKITLVVLIDDLDRCLPETAIATLEAMRLFLFLDRTAFVIAADEDMIRESVRVHFKGAQLSEGMVRSYFDKLIQLPFRVPPLGTQDVRAYLMMLFIDASELEPDRKDEIRDAVCMRLGQTWNGARFDRAFVLETIGDDCTPDLRSRIAIADRIAPILTSSPEIRGNPRLIKRFLNSLALRASLAERQGVAVDEEVLMKLLLFERCGTAEAYGALLSSVNVSADGRSNKLKQMEEAVRGETSAPLDKPFDVPFVRDWLLLDPPLGERDLRAAAYVSRDNFAIIGRPDELSPEALELLDALLAATQPSPPLTEKAKALSYRDAAAIMDRILVKAGEETRWGVPSILNAALAVASVDDRHARELSSFLANRPGPQLEAGIVPRVVLLPWGKDLLRLWANKTDLSAPMRKRVEREIA